MRNFVYIATRLENHVKYGEVRDALAKIGIEISYDWTTHGPVWRSGVRVIQKTALAEMQGVEDGDFCIVILPGGRGTHVELGMALAMKKKVLVLAESPETQAMQGAIPETCAFYHHPNVFWHDSIQSLIDSCKAIK